MEASPTLADHDVPWVGGNVLAALLRDDDGDLGRMRPVVAPGVRARSTVNDHVHLWCITDKLFFIE